MRYLVFLFHVWLTFLNVSSGKNDLEIKTVSGVVRGLTVPSYGKETVNAFLGIPYGAPTTGQNRFAPPKKANPWDGVFDASSFSRPCYQVIAKMFRTSSWWVSSNLESEDCLKLNVWVPKPRPKKAAVMVWIHGGGYAGGSTDIPQYSGAILAAQENVIVVSMNYRLSAFGFLYLNHPLAPGNVGLMDQALGLQWVRENIKAFGGDPKKVTILGQSAGAACVVSHLLSPTSLDLFQNAIAHSGSMNAVWGTSEPDYAIEQGLKLAERAGCPADKNKVDEVIRCLQGVSIEKLFDAAVFVEGGFLKMKFRPVVDGKYLTGHPSSLLSGGKFCSSKNVMIGFTKEDGSFILPSIAPQLMKMDTSTYTEEELKHLVSRLTVLNDEISGLPLELISLFYSKTGPSGHSLSFEDVLNLMTDRWFGCPISTTAQKMTDNGNNVFFFRFDHVPSVRDSSLPTPPWFGSAHGDDLAHLFGLTLKTESQATPEEVKLTKQFMRYWANFAKTGDPNDDYLPTWPKYTSQNKSWIQFHGNGLTVSSVQRQKECAFWEHIYPEIETQFRNKA